MEALARIVSERHVDWAPILEIINGETGTAAVASLNGALAAVGCAPADFVPQRLPAARRAGRDLR